MAKPKQQKPKKRPRQSVPQWRLECNEDHTDCKAVKIDFSKGVEDETVQANKA